MRRIATIIAVGLLATACTNPYTGQIDPLATGLAVGLGAVAVGAVGYAAGQNSAPRYYQPVPRYNHYSAPRYYQPAPRYHYNPGYRRW